MTRRVVLLVIKFFTLIFFLIDNNFAQTITTICGNGTYGYSIEGAIATNANILGNNTILVDKKGNIYFTDSINNCKIKKIDTSHTISLFAGNGTFTNTGDGGPATAAGLAYNYHLNHDKFDNIYLGFDKLIRKIDRNGIISTFAGTGVRGFSGDGGPATNAKIFSGFGMCFDRYNNCFFADAGNCRIRKIDTNNIITTVAGTGILGSTGDGGPATAARLYYPDYLYMDSIGNIYFAEDNGSTTYKIRKIDSSGFITTAVGAGPSGYTGDGGPATAAHVWGIYTLDNCGNVILSTWQYNRIRIIDHNSGVINTLYGTASPGYAGDGGPATAAQFHGPRSMSTDCAGNIFVVDDSNFRIREIVYPNSAPTFTGGHNQALSLCHDSGPHNLGAVLSVHDTDCGQVLSWLPLSAPSHGSLVATFTANTNTGTVTPTGLTYTPDTGFVGSDSFTVVVSDCGHLSDTTKINVFIAPNARAGVITGPSVTCLSDSIALTDTVVGGVWRSRSPGVATVSTTGMVTGLATGTDTIFYTLTNACGVDSVFHMVTVTTTPPATASISGASSVCTGATTTLTDATAGGTWRTTNTNATVSGSGVVRGLSGGIDTIFYKVINACRTDSVFHVVTINPLPVPGTISGNDSVCTGSTITLTDTTTGGTWSSRRPTIATISSGGVVTGVASGTTTISYSLTNSCGTAGATHMVTVLPVPSAALTITGAVFFCAGDSVVLSVPTAAGNSYQWYGGSSGGATTPISGATSPRLAAYNTGYYAVQVTSPNGCSSNSVTTLVTSINRPAITPSGPAKFCIGSSVLLGTVAGSGISYQWQKNSTNIVGATTNTLVANTSGNYSVHVSISGGCSATSDSFAVTVTPAPHPLITFNGTYFSTYNFYATYQWFLNTVTIPGATNNTFYAYNNGSYTVMVTDTNGCRTLSGAYQLNNLEANNIASYNNIQIIPNPANTIVRVVNPAMLIIDMYTPEGKKILQATSNTDIDISMLPNGLYLLYMSDENGYRVRVEKMIKQ